MTTTSEPVCADCGDDDIPEGAELCSPCLARARDEEEQDYEEARDDYERGLR